MAIYALVVIVPAVALAAEAGDIRGFSYLGIEIFPPRATRMAAMRALQEWHGTLGWIFRLLVLGNIAMAVGWHHLTKRDGLMNAYPVKYATGVDSFWRFMALSQC